MKNRLVTEYEPEEQLEVSENPEEVTDYDYEDGEDEDDDSQTYELCVVETVKKYVRVYADSAEHAKDWFSDVILKDFDMQKNIDSYERKVESVEGVGIETAEYSAY